MFTDYRKLSYLVPDADCDTSSGIITVWRDARPQPTYEEINAVADADVEQKKQEDDEDNFRVDNHAKILATVAWNHENRIRVIEGRPEIAFRQFVRAVKTS